MTPEQQIDLATELWAIAQAPTTEIGIEGVTRLMMPVIAAYTAAVEAKERERCAAVCDEQGAPESFTDKVRSIYEVATIDCGDAIREMK